MKNNLIKQIFRKFAEESTHGLHKGDKPLKLNKI